MGRERPWLGPLVALVVVYLLFVVLSPDTFARPANLVTMARQTAVVGVAASGMTMVIMLGGIDLSVGSAVALTTVVVASLLKAGAGPWAAALAGVAVAALAGAVNGALIAGLGLTPFIVTLGSMSILRGAAKGLAHEQKIDADPRGLDALLLPPDRGLPGLPPGGVADARGRRRRGGDPAAHALRPARRRHRLQRGDGAPLRRRGEAGEDPGLHALRRARGRGRGDRVRQAHRGRPDRLRSASSST